MAKLNRAVMKNLKGQEKRKGVKQQQHLVQVIIKAGLTVHTG